MFDASLRLGGHSEERGSHKVSVTMLGRQRARAYLSSFRCEMGLGLVGWMEWMVVVWWMEKIDWERMASPGWLSSATSCHAARNSPGLSAPQPSNDFDEQVRLVFATIELIKSL